MTEILKSLKSVYNTLRIILWIVYIAAILVIVLTILGFVFEVKIHSLGTVPDMVWQWQEFLDFCGL